MTDLFGEKADPDTGTPNGSQKEKFEKHYLQALRSWFFKTCRTGQAQEAMIAGMLLHRGVSTWYLLNTCLNLLGEDCDPDEFARIAPTIMGAMQQKSPSHHTIYHIVFLVATAKKWYMTAWGEYLETCRHSALPENLPTLTAPDDFPDFCFDRHTTEGWRRIRSGADVDLGLDGGWDNRWPLRDLFETITAKCDNINAKMRFWAGFWSARTKAPARTDPLRGGPTDFGKKKGGKEQ